MERADSGAQLAYGGSMKASFKHRSALTGGLVLAVCSALLSPVGPTHADDSQQGGTGANQRARLNLGPADLPEHRTVTTLAPGVTLTKISRGGADPSLFWTAEVAIPSDSPDPDAPASALSSQATAQHIAEKLKAAGVDARHQPVDHPVAVGAPVDQVAHMHHRRLGMLVDQPMCGVEAGRRRLRHIGDALAAQNAVQVGDKHVDPRGIEMGAEKSFHILFCKSFSHLTRSAWFWHNTITAVGLSADHISDCGICRVKVKM